jgi:hypothetical protein
MISLPVNHFDPNAKSEHINPTLLTRSLQTRSLKRLRQTGKYAPTNYWATNMGYQQPQKFCSADPVSLESGQINWQP